MPSANKAMGCHVFSQVLILKVVKVICFHALLQVLNLKSLARQLRVAFLLGAEGVEERYGELFEVALVAGGDCQAVYPGGGGDHGVFAEGDRTAVD